MHGNLEEPACVSCGQKHESALPTVKRNLQFRPKLSTSLPGLKNQLLELGAELRRFIRQSRSHPTIDEHCHTVRVTCNWLHYARSRPDSIARESNQSLLAVTSATDWTPASPDYPRYASPNQTKPTLRYRHHESSTIEQVTGSFGRSTTNEDPFRRLAPMIPR